MACRLEEIPKAGDYVVYDNLDHSVIVVRDHDRSVKAYHNSCRHRGMQLVEDRGSSPGGFVCPFHAWCYGLDGRHTYMLAPEIFEPRVIEPEDISLRSCRVEVWGGAAFINLDDNAPSLIDSFQPTVDRMAPFHVDRMQTEWWRGTRLPVNWKLALDAFMEGYHLLGSHPQLVPRGVRGSNATYAPVIGTTYREPPSGPVDPKILIDTILELYRTISEGMGGMIHQKDVMVAEGLRQSELPTDPGLAASEFIRQINDAIVAWNRQAGIDMEDMNALVAKGLLYPAANIVNYCFPHYFVAPIYGNAIIYRVRPLGPEECIFDVGSLTLFPEGADPQPPSPPDLWEYDDERWPEIIKQDFSTLVKQQRGVRSRGFERMRLSGSVEGMISNYNRLIDGYLAGLDGARLVSAVRKVNGMIEQPVEDLAIDR
jgi:phenylpropionate dioxygenase-like ring-hydroxylating dioxygenase large terminal subunit